MESISLERDVVLGITSVSNHYALRALSSFAHAFDVYSHSIPIVILYQGDDSNTIRTMVRGWNVPVTVVSSDKQTRFVDRLEKAFGHTLEAIFGPAEHMRGYGGASNLLLAVALALRYRYLLKTDEDCLAENYLGDHRGWELVQDWAGRMCQQLETCDLCSSGYTGDKSYSEPEVRFKEEYYHILKANFEPFDAELPDYRMQKFGKRIVFGEVDKSLENPLSLITNGNLGISMEVARQICFPAVIHKPSGIKLRGEEYVLGRRACERGFRYVYDSTNPLGHDRSLITSAFLGWLQNIAFTRDLHYVLAGVMDRGTPPPLAARIAEIKRFAAKLREISHLHPDIGPLADMVEHESMDFSDSQLERIMRAFDLWPQVARAVVEEDFSAILLD